MNNNLFFNTARIAQKNPPN